MKRRYIVEIDDDPHYLGKTRVRLYKPHFPIPGQAVGDLCGNTTVANLQYVGRGIKKLLCGEFGNPPERNKPALRERTIRHEPGQGTLCVSHDGSRLAWLPEDDYQRA